MLLIMEMYKSISASQLLKRRKEKFNLFEKVFRVEFEAVSAINFVNF